jgi:hypothetical protein
MRTLSGNVFSFFVKKKLVGTGGARDGTGIHYSSNVPAETIGAVNETAEGMEGEEMASVDLNHGGSGRMVQSNLAQYSISTHHDSFFYGESISPFLGLLERVVAFAEQNVLRRSLHQLWDVLRIPPKHNGPGQDRVVVMPIGTWALFVITVTVLMFSFFINSILPAMLLHNLFASLEFVLFVDGLRIIGLYIQTNETTLGFFD